jgi:gliding motility-associated-like protein
VLDNNNCRFDTIIFVFEPVNIQITGFTKQDITCNGNVDGEIHVTATGGMLIKYQLLDGSNALLRENKTVSDFLNLVAGSYKVVAADSINSCIKSDTTVVIQITEPDVLQITQIDTSNYICFGSSNGFIRFHTVTGGTRPYQYSINNGSTWQFADSSFTGLSAITYNLIVRDTNKCLATFPAVTLKQANQITIDNVVVTPTNCNNDPIGKIQIFASGGNSMLTFSRDGITYQADSTFSGLTSGTYTIYVRDTLTKCVVNTTATVTVSGSGMSPISVITTDPLCYGNYEGIIIVTSPVGVQYSLNGGTFQSDNQFLGLAAGTYTVRAKDANGCIESMATTLKALPISVKADVTPQRGSVGGSIRITQVTNINPAGDAVRFSIDGGSTWHTTDSTFTGLNAGTYTITVNSITNNCRKDTSFTVGIVRSLSATVSADYSLNKCYGDRNGVIDIEVTEPSPAMPIRYIITGPVSKDTSINGKSLLLSNLPTGNYAITLTDNLGTPFQDAVWIGPSKLILTPSVYNPICNAGANGIGSIDLTVSGGTPPYSYVWSNKATSQTLFNLPVGHYAVTVTDNNQCTDSAARDIHSTYNVTANAGRDTTICPNIPYELQGSGTSPDVPNDAVHYVWYGGYNRIDTISYNSKPVITLPPIANRDSSVKIYLLETYIMIYPYTCQNFDTVKITVAPVHGLAIGAHELTGFIIQDTVKIGIDVPLQLEAVPDSFVSYTWNPKDYMDNPVSHTPTVTFPDYGNFSEYSVYSVTGITREGCIENSRITIDVGRIVVPTGFTPNGDGKHDKWIIDNAELYPNIVVEVFNRWGEKVFESKGYNKDIAFDGKRNGRNLPSGTYYYIITINNNISKGTVTIVR